jgi:hypothetical protein
MEACWVSRGTVLLLLPNSRGIATEQLCYRSIAAAVAHGGAQSVTVEPGGGISGR